MNTALLGRVEVLRNDLLSKKAYSKEELITLNTYIILFKSENKIEKARRQQYIKQIFEAELFMNKKWDELSKIYKKKKNKKKKNK